MKAGGRVYNLYMRFQGVFQMHVKEYKACV